MEARETSLILFEQDGFDLDVDEVPQLQGRCNGFLFCFTLEDQLDPTPIQHVKVSGNTVEMNTGSSSRLRIDVVLYLISNVLII